MSGRQCCSALNSLNYMPEIVHVMESGGYSSSQVMALVVLLCEGLGV